MSSALTTPAAHRASWLRRSLAVALLGCVAACNRPGPLEPGVTEGSTTPPTAGAVGPSSPAQPVQSTRPAQAHELFPASQTYAVISGVLSWPDAGLAGFATRDRKDVALARMLEQRGVPASHVKLLIDAEATTRAILEAVEGQAKQAPPGSTLLFYYAGHGVRAKDGKAYFASRDMNARAPATGLSLDDLAKTVAAHFKGHRIVLMADCCYSGELKGVAEQLHERGFAAVSLTSAAAANVSTNNWTFTQAVLDALAGDALCDESGDGIITLKELSSEVQAAMLYREGQRHGFHRVGVPPSTTVARAVAATGPLPQDRRQYVEAEIAAGWQVARVRAVEGGQLTVRTFDYAASADHRVAASQTKPIEFRRYAPGAAIQVYWGGKVWPAEVLQADGDLHFITYPGWPPVWNEWVTSRRIVDAGAAAANISVSAKVMVEWRGKWFPAQVLKRQGSRYLVHYAGYDASWDEWVGPSRIRQR